MMKRFLSMMVILAHCTPLLASQPLFSFIPVQKAPDHLAVNEIATVIYQVTNQSEKTHRLAMKPISGVTQISAAPGACAKEFTLVGHESCLLNLIVSGSNMPQDIRQGPTVCAVTSGQLNDSLCYQPSLADSLNIKLVGPTTPSILPFGFGAVIYDYFCPGSPNGPCSVLPGEWKTSIANFNLGATSSDQVSRLYPYSSDIEIQCTYTTQGQVISCTVISSGYSNGNASVEAYHDAFQNALVLPTVDSDLTYLDNKVLLSDPTVADEVAADLVAEVCADDKADGVFFDLVESRNSLSKDKNPGLYEFYQQVSGAFAAPPCKNTTTHPQGRYLGIFLTPSYNDWQAAQTMFVGQNGYFAIPLYDNNEFTQPPTPGNLGEYSTYVKKLVQNVSVNSQTFQIPYTFVIPAGASYGTFQEYGIYNPTYPNNFQLIQDYSSNATQLQYVQTDRSNICVSTNQSPYYRGMDYWSWQQYIKPYSVNKPIETIPLLMPNPIDASVDAPVVTYLQTCATCTETCP